MVHLSAVSFPNAVFTFDHDVAADGPDLGAEKPARASVAFSPVEGLLDEAVLAGGSFRFQVGRDSWFEAADGVITRIIEEIDELADVCACTWPAYEATSLWMASDRSPSRSGAGTAAARERQRQLNLLEMKGVELAAAFHAGERRDGRRISRPPWFVPRGFIRRGCGHCAEVDPTRAPSMFAAAGLGL